ncbi:hypothetical protein BKA69DRAFT_1164377 [Paraphysoderma sedebokerense]|nr:hypothetical protein BKA69DRAFT_1164377 [Paraphysoderma sedebokerense]
MPSNNFLMGAPDSLTTFMSSDVKYNLKSRPLCIITAKREELVEVLKRLQELSDSGDNSKKTSVYLDPLPVTSNGCTFHLGHIRISTVKFENEVKGNTTPEGSDRIIHFYATCGYRQGLQSFAVYGTRIFSLYEPKYAIMVGICCGDKNKLGLQDVVFASKAIPFEEGKTLPDGNLSPDTNPETASEGISDAAIALIKNSKRKDWHHGTMLSGGTVRMNAIDVFKRVQQNIDRSSNALDMEASAFFAACKQCGVVALPVIKAVVDFGDMSKSDVEHLVSLHKATDATVDFLKDYFRPRFAELPPTEVDFDAVKYNRGQRELDMTKQWVERSKSNLIFKLEKSIELNNRLVISNEEEVVLKKEKNNGSLSYTKLNAVGVHISEEQKAKLRDCGSESTKLVVQNRENIKKRKRGKY